VTTGYLPGSCTSSSYFFLLLASTRKQPSGGKKVNATKVIFEIKVSKVSTTMKKYQNLEVSKTNLVVLWMIGLSFLVAYFTSQQSHCRCCEN
jgi:hypothetical protein